MFLMYMNDMEIATKCKPLLYADDSTLLASGKDVKIIEQNWARSLKMYTSGW